MFWVYFVRDFYRAGAQAEEQRCIDVHQPRFITPATFPVAALVGTSSGCLHYDAVPKPTFDIVTGMSLGSVVNEEAEAIKTSAPSTEIYCVAETEAIAAWAQESMAESAGQAVDDDAWLMPQILPADVHDIPVMTDAAIAEVAPVDVPEIPSVMEEIAALAEVSDEEIAEVAANPEMIQVQEDVLLLSRKLQKLQAALAVSDRGRSAFLSSMSHELRTPLNAIMGFSDMMKSGVFGPIENPTYAQYVNHIHDSGALLLSKINDLLDIASMDVGQMAIEDEECELMPILEELVEIHSHAAFAREQNLRIDAPDNIIVQADRSKLLCALSHFVTNAMRHSADGGQITIMARVQADGELVLSVRDTGEGIPTDQLTIIREALQAPVAYHHIECGGIGLGLSLSKELAAAHGGRLMLDSMRRRGTVVSLILPEDRVLGGAVRRKNRVESGEWRLV